MGYNLGVVYDYIWGNDIKGYDICELENDPSFMLQVLERTMDKKMYDLCSDDVKEDYAFVRGVIKLFSSDLDFITEVANTYIDSLTEGEKIIGDEYSELNIIMSDLLGKTVNDFAIRAASFYEVERIRIRACVSVSDEDVRMQSREGFAFTAIQYERNPIIVDFVARRMINEALYGKKCDNLEYLIHKRFKSVEELENYGSMNFLYDYISEYDYILGEYAFDSNRVDMLPKFFDAPLKDIDRIKRYWETYMDKLNAYRVYLVERELSEYLLDNPMVDLSFDEVLAYVTNKLHVADVFKKYDTLVDLKYDGSKYKVLDISSVNLISKVTNLTNRLFSSDVIDYSYDDYLESDGAEKDNVNQTNNRKIIDFSKTKKK